MEQKHIEPLLPKMVRFRIRVLLVNKKQITILRLASVHLIGASNLEFNKRLFTNDNYLKLQIV